MPEKYLYKDKVLQRKEVEDAAKQSGMDIDTYSKKAGLQRVNDNYNYNGKTISAEDVFDAAKQSGIGFDDYLQKAKITALPDEKKKFASVDLEGSSLEAGNSLSQSNGEDGSQIPTIEMYTTPSGEMVEANPIALSKKFNELSNRKKEVSQIGGATMGTTSTLVDDENAQKDAKKIKEDFPNVDLEGIHNELAGLSDDILSNVGKELMTDREQNNPLYQRKVANLKWRNDFEHKILDDVNKGNIDPENYNRLKHSIDTLPEIASSGDFRNQRAAIKSLAQDISEYGGENKDEILKNFAVEVSKVYGNPDNKPADLFKDSPESKYLNNDEQLALQYLKDVAPEKAQQYDRLNIDPKTIKDNPDAVRAVNHLHETLEETSIGLQQNAVTEELNSLKNIAKKNNGLSETELNRAKELEKKNEELSQKRNELDSKYPDRIPDKAADAVNEVMGKDINWLEYAAVKTGQAFKNTGEGIWEAVSTPFMSDASNQLRELSLMGESITDEKNLKQPDRNKALLTDKMVIKPELQTQVDAIKNNAVLTDEQKRSKLFSLFYTNPDKFGRVPIQDGKFNISPSSILYGLTDLGTSLIPFVALETVTGGGATAGAARKFLSTFTAAAATTFHDEYANAVMQGKSQSDAYKSAMASTAITSFAMAGASTPTELRAMAKGNSSAEKIIQGMSDKAIQDVLDKGTPKGLTKLKQAFVDRAKATPEMISGGLKTGAKFEAYMAGANELNGKEQNFKQSLLNIANFGIMGAGLGHVGYKSPTELQKGSIVEFGKNPDAFRSELDDMKKNGMSQSEYDHRKMLIDKSEEAYKTLPKANAKGQPLTEKEKGEYMYNTVIKNEGKKSASTLPPKQAEKAEMTAMVADHANDIILDTPTDKQLQDRKDKLEKALIPEKDADGKNIEIPEKELLNTKAELQAVNDELETRKSFQKVEIPRKDITLKEQPTVSETEGKSDVVVDKASNVGGDVRTNNVNGYEFTKTPTLENVVVEPIDKSNNAIIEKQMFVDENKNVLNSGVKYIGGGWYEIGGDNFGGVDLYNTVTKEGVSLNHKQGGRMGVVVQDFIKNNSRYNDNIAVRGSKFTQEEHNPKFGGSGHYKGTYFYVGLSAESKALEHGKNLTKVDIENANLYELGEDGQTSQSLKNEAKKAGYDTRDASGYAESEYLKKQGYDGIKRGNEIVLFEPKKFEVKAVEQSLSTKPEIKNEEAQVTEDTNTSTVEIKEQPVVSEPAQQTGGGEENVTGVKKAITDETRAANGMPKVVFPKMSNDVEALNAAKERVDSGKVNPQEMVDRINKEKTNYKNEDEVMDMQYYAHQLQKRNTELNEQLADAETPEQKLDIVNQKMQLSDLIDAQTEAAQTAGNQWGKTGNRMQPVINDAGQIFRENKNLIKEAYGGEVPKEVQAKLDALTKERDDALAAKAKVEEQLKQKMAERGFEEVKKQAKKTAKRNETKEALKKEEDQLLNDLKQAFKKDLGNLNSGIPIPKETLDTLGKLAINYFKQGVNGLEALVDRLHENLKDTGLTRKQIKDAIANYEPLTIEQETARLNKKADLLMNRVTPATLDKKGRPTEPVDLAAPPKEQKFFRNNTNWVKANQRVANAEHQMKILKRQAFESKKNLYQKGLMWLGRLTRLSVLSGKVVLAKLASAAVIGGAMKRIPEQAITAIYSTAFKGIAKKAPIEGFWNAKAEAKFYKDFFNPKKFAKNSWEILKSGSTDLGKRLGGAEYEHVPVLYLPTDLHQIIKDPLKRAAFEASFHNGLVWAEKNGLDINDPLVINSIENAAYKRAQYEIFQESNKLSRWFVSQKSALEKGGNAGATAKFVVDFMIPVSTVPANIVRRVATTSPVGMVRGSVKVIDAYRKGLEKLTNEEAESIMKQLKQGTLGTALWLAGWFGYQSFGGLYSQFNPNKKREEDDKMSDVMIVNGKEIPKPVQHALLLEVIQMAATARRIYENYKENKNASTTEALTAAGLGSIGALAEQIPVVETPMHMVLATQDPVEADKLKEDLGRRIKPQIMREFGAFDSDFKNSKEGKFLDEHGLKIVDIHKEGIHPVDAQGNKIKVSDEKFNQLVTVRERKIQDEIKVLRNEGAVIWDEGKKIDAKDLTDDQLKRWLMKTSTKAKNDAIDEVFGKQPETESKPAVETYQ